jgi:hypothetical protein
MTNTQGISGERAGRIMAGQMRNEAADKSRIVRAKVTDIGDRVTDGLIKCLIPARNQTVYVDAAAGLISLAVNDWVWIRKMDSGWRDMWILMQFDRTGGGSSVPTLRADAIALDHLDASDGAPAPAWQCDAAGRLVPQAATCYLLMSGYAGALTLDADGDTAIDATVDDRIDFKINTTLRHSFGLTALVLNENGDDMDIRMEGSGAANAFFVQGSDGHIGIGTNNPTEEVVITKSQNGDTMMRLDNINAGTSARARLEINNDNGGFNLIVASSGYTDNVSWRNMAVLGIDAALDGFIFYTPTGEDMVFECGAIGTTDVIFEGDGDVGIGAGITPAAQLHVDQSSATGAQPVLMLDQADLSEEMIEFVTTIGVGNPIEAVGAKTLTTTHFIKVTLPGALTRYMPVGTIA